MADPKLDASEDGPRISTEDFDRLFDAGKDILEYCDPASLERPDLTQRRVGVDMPNQMIERLDARAEAMGIARQALIKTWLSERLDLEDRLDVLSGLKRRKKDAATGEQTQAPEQP